MDRRRFLQGAFAFLAVSVAAKVLSACGAIEPSAPMKGKGGGPTSRDVISLRQALERTYGRRVRFEPRQGPYGVQEVAIIDNRFCHEFVVNDGWFGRKVLPDGSTGIKLPPGFDPQDAHVNGIFVRWDAVNSRPLDHIAPNSWCD